MVKNSKLCIYIVLFFVLTISAFSQLNLYIDFIAPQEQVDSQDYPNLTARLRAEFNGNPIQLEPNQIVVIEDNRAAKVTSATPLSFNWQTVTWHTRLKGIRSYNIAKFIVSYQNEVATVEGGYSQPNYSKVLIRNQNGIQIDDLYFGSTPANSRRLEQIKVTPITGRRLNNIEQPLRIDSVKTQSPYFTYFWQGSELNRQPPPTLSEAGEFNLVDVWFKPVDNSYYKDLLSVYYDNGTKEDLNLFGNFYGITRNTMLKLIRPIGGELLAPCQQYEIKWTGYARGIATIIEFSSNGGRDWEQIGTSGDSTFLWTVPKSYTETGLIRVKQEFASNADKPLRSDNISIKRITFDYQGANLLSGNAEGTLREWELTTYTLKNTYYINQPKVDYIDVDIHGVEYLADNNRFAVCYNYQLYSGKILDTLAIFELGKSGPVQKIPIEDGFFVKRMLIDSKRQIIALIPELGTQVKLLSALDGSFIKNIDFPVPVDAFAFNPVLDQAVAYLINGEARILSVPDFTILSTLDLSNLPIVKEISLAPDGKLLGIGCYAPLYSTYGANTEIHVLDINLQKSVRISRVTASDPVGVDFNPSSSVLLVGSKAQPQIAFWDLPTSDYIGSLSGSNMLLTDIRFSPEGHSLAFSSESSNNLIYKTFTYPEFDQSKSFFRIVKPILSLDSLTVDSAFIATDNDEVFTKVICNTGEVPVILNSAHFYFGVHFHLADAFNVDTLYPGDCIDAKFYYHPLDTGKISDTLIFTSYCMVNYGIPIDTYGKKRNISFFQNVYDFGEECLGNTKTVDFDLIRNEDPVPLKLNAIGFVDPMNSPFGLGRPLKDTILGAHQALRYPLTFNPKELGKLTRKLAIYHSDQLKMIPEKEAIGTGIGTIFDKSHDDLLFIPEILTRKVTIYNRSQNPINLVESVIDPPGNFEFITQVPIFIKVGDSADVEVKWLGKDKSTAVLTFKATPCLAYNKINLAFYTGASMVSCPTVEADPRLNATIPVNFTNSELKAYRGVRFFESEIMINPRLFLPQEVTSNFGQAKLTRNEIVNDRRIIGIRVDGDFSTKGVVAEIKGIAGIAETDTSKIEFTSNSKYWGTSVSITAIPGVFKLIGLCGDRRILHENSINILSIMPNPAKEFFAIEYETENSGGTNIEIWDNLGQKVYSTESFFSSTGKNQVNINSSRLGTGTYRVVIRIGNLLTSQSLAIVR